MTTQAAVALQSTQMVEQMRKSTVQEMEFFDVIADVTSEIDLGAILGKVMSQATKMLNAERSTLFLNDEKTNDLFSKVGEGLDATRIHLPIISGQPELFLPRVKRLTSLMPMPISGLTRPSTKKPAFSPAPFSACR